MQSHQKGFLFRAKNLELIDSVFVQARPLIQKYYMRPASASKPNFFWNFPAVTPESSLVEQIFPPPLVAMPDQPHQLA
jgi:hypothetical protein